MDTSSERRRRGIEASEDLGSGDVRVAPPRQVGRSLVIVAALGAIAGVSSLPAASAEGYWQNCPPVASYLPSILSHGVQCDVAKKVINRVYVKGQKQGAADPDGSLTINGFRCTLHSAQAIGPKRPITCGKKVLIFDDVFTDGFTMREVARLLRLSGARDVAGVVLARQPRGG